MLVVNRFEVIDIEHEHGEAVLAPFRQRDFPAQHRGQETSIQQVCQLIPPAFQFHHLLEHRLGELLDLLHDPMNFAKQRGARLNVVRLWVILHFADRFVALAD